MVNDRQITEIRSNGQRDFLRLLPRFVRCVEQGHVTGEGFGLQVPVGDCGDPDIYPVPASDLLTIDYSHSTAEHLFLEIYDPSGRKILMKQYHDVTALREVLDVSGMAAGIYVIRLRTTDRQLIRLVILN